MRVPHDVFVVWFLPARRPRGFARADLPVSALPPSSHRMLRTGRDCVRFGTALQQQGSDLIRLTEPS